MKRLSSAVLPRGRRSGGRALSSSFPGPIRPGYGGHPRPAPTSTGEVAKTPDSKGCAAGEGGGGGPGRASLWRGGRRARRTHCSPPRTPSPGPAPPPAVTSDPRPRARRGGRAHPPAGSRCVEVGAPLSSRFVPTSAHSRHRLASYGASHLGKLQKKKCFPTSRESLHQRGVGVGTQSNSGVARTMEIKGEWPPSDASGTSVCILKSEPSLLPKRLEKCPSLLEEKKKKPKRTNSNVIFLRLTNSFQFKTLFSHQLNGGVFGRRGIVTGEPLF